MQLAGDFLLVLRWWLLTIPAGVAVFSVLYPYGYRLNDRGYMVAKMMGLLLPAYFIWLLVSLKLPIFTDLGVRLFSVLILGILLIAGYKNVSKGKAGNGGFDLAKDRVIYWILAEEGLFLAAFTCWSYIRGVRPAIFGLEKYMDFGFVNAIYRSPVMPPADMWYAGESINYYYFGHYFCAFMSKLSGVLTSVGYNLMIAFLFALVLVMSFSLTASLVFNYERKHSIAAVAGGVMTATLVSLGSSFHTVIYAYILPLLKGESLGQYFYPTATRYIGYMPDIADKTIHEIPSYSFIVADLHGHVSGLPLVLAFITLLYMAYESQFRGDRGQDPSVKISYQLVLGWLLGLFVMTNTWDYPIYMMVLGITLIISLPSWRSMDAWINMIRVLRNVILVSIVTAAPFLLSFNNFSQGVAFVYSRTPLYQLLVLWGHYLIPIGILVVLLCQEYGVSKLIGESRGSDQFFMILAGSAIILIMIPEIIYVRDIYSTHYYRANTMFKMTYQAAVMFSIVSGYAISRLWIKRHGFLKRFIAILAVIVCVGTPLLYPYFSIPGYYGKLRFNDYQGIDGIAFMKGSEPGDWEMIQWLMQQEGQFNILEADGDSYSHAGRISASTGLPTILGWHVHQWLWRGDYALVEHRMDLVKSVYEGSITEAKEILQEFNIQYIILGRYERERYPAISSEDIYSLGEIVFQSSDGGSAIIRVDITH